MGAELTLRLDVVDQLPRITRRTLGLVGELGTVTPVEASRQIYDRLTPDIRRWELMPAVGHFPWLDDPDLFFRVLADFVSTA